jgi:hypothetical protein
MLVNKVLYQLNHISRPFAFNMFFRLGLELSRRPVLDWDSPTSAPQVAGTTEIYHHTPSLIHFLKQSSFRKQHNPSLCSYSGISRAYTVT